MVAPVGAVLSLVKATGVADVLPATSRPVTLPVGELVVPAVQENTFDTYGPPAGVDTVGGVCDQPVVVPPSAAVVLDAGPEPLSTSALVSVTEPAAAPR